jgi:hypothetical protein
MKCSWMPALLLLGFKPEGITWYKKSLEVAPDSIPTHLWLGETSVAASHAALARSEPKRSAAITQRGVHQKQVSECGQKAENLVKKLSAG